MRYVMAHDDGGGREEGQDPLEVQHQLLGRVLAVEEDQAVLRGPGSLGDGCRGEADVQVDVEAFPSRDVARQRRAQVRHALVHLRVQRVHGSAGEELCQDQGAVAEAVAEHEDGPARPRGDHSGVQQPVAEPEEELHVSQRYAQRVDAVQGPGAVVLVAEPRVEDDSLHGRRRQRRPAAVEERLHRARHVPDLRPHAAVTEGPHDGLEASQGCQRARWPTARLQGPWPGHLCLAGLALNWRGCRRAAHLPEAPGPPVAVEGHEAAALVGVVGHPLDAQVLHVHVRPPPGHELRGEKAPLALNEALRSCVVHKPHDAALLPLEDAETD
mmetsp:Transcript_25906/g.74286  ORF Transcript_25906/g.74286 Transcript_25906/m.74286 type:complete len:327 (+) Transcript_25906:294-1274(+)